jgi:N-methylhydantoinase A
MSTDTLPRGGARLSADIGGTFTDIVLERGPDRWSRKVLTTHAAPEQGILQGIAQTLAEADVEPREVFWVVHGTTLATNALIERRGARTALLTTEGFRDVLEIGYEGRYDPMDLRLVKRMPLVPRELRLTVRERMSARGDVLISLDENAISATVARLRDLDVESLAIGFLHSYANASHEQRAREIIQAQLEDLSISLSSDVCPEIREYERMSTVAANAYVQPLIAGYLDRLSQSLSDIGLRCPMLLMASGGGLIPIDLARKVPVRLVESGPAGGAVLSSALALELAESRVLSFDMGGTTAKICFIADGKPQIARLFEVDRAARFQKGSGLPLRTPVVELIEIGAGGGSIAGVDAMGRVTVGPQSAGSEPGPAAYDRGGSRPTVTDADLLLRKLDPRRFAAGRIALNPERAACVLKREIADRLKLNETGAAFGITELVDETMANAARVHAAELGKDIASHTMIAFGGAAPLHAARLAEKLGISRIVVPRNAGVGSAVGFLMAPLAYDIVVSRPVHLHALTEDKIDELLRELGVQVAAAAKDLGVDDVTTTYHVDMRYVGQGHEVTVDMPKRVDDTRTALRQTFEASYRLLFGRIIPDAPIEIVSWQATLSKAIWRPLAPPEVMVTAPPPARDRRQVFESKAGRFIEYAVYERRDFVPGARVAGPALIVEDETTTVATSSFAVSMDQRNHLLLDRIPDPRGRP